MSEPSSVYRFFDSLGLLLYVGITNDANKRIVAHRRDKDWFDRVVRIEIAHFDSRDDALAAEAEAIEFERPLMNKKAGHHVDDVIERRQRWAAMSADQRADHLLSLLRQQQL